MTWKTLLGHDTRMSGRHCNPGGDSCRGLPCCVASQACLPGAGRQATEIRASTAIVVGVFGSHWSSAARVPFGTFQCANQDNLLEVLRADVEQYFGWDTFVAAGAMVSHLCLQRSSETTVGAQRPFACYGLAAYVALRHTSTIVGFAEAGEVWVLLSIASSCVCVCVCLASGQLVRSPLPW